MTAGFVFQNAAAAGFLAVAALIPAPYDLRLFFAVIGLVLIAHAWGNKLLENDNER